MGRLEPDCFRADHDGPEPWILAGSPGHHDLRGDGERQASGQSTAGQRDHGPRPGAQRPDPPAGAGGPGLPIHAGLGEVPESRPTSTSDGRYACVVIDPVLYPTSVLGGINPYGPSTGSGSSKGTTCCDSWTTPTAATGRRSSWSGGQRRYEPGKGEAVWPCDSIINTAGTDEITSTNPDRVRGMPSGQFVDEQVLYLKSDDPTHLRGRVYLAQGDEDDADQHGEVAVFYALDKGGHPRGVQASIDVPDGDFVEAVPIWRKVVHSASGGLSPRQHRALHGPRTST